MGKLLLNERFVGLGSSAGAAVSGFCFGFWVFKGHKELVQLSCPSEKSLCVFTVPTQCHSDKMNNHRENWHFLELNLSFVL